MDSGRLSQNVQEVLWSWNEAKQFVEHAFVISHDALHLIIGVLVLLLAAILLRRPVSSWRPWLVVFVLTCINELVDLWVEQWPEPAMQYGEGAKDLLLTMLLPTVLLVASRFFPSVFAPEPKR